MSGLRKRRTEGWSEFQRRRSKVGRQRFVELGFRSAVQIWISRCWDWAKDVSVAASIRMRRYTTHTVEEDVETVPNRRQINTRAMAAAAASLASQISQMSSGGRRRTT
eukprot:606434-Pyramimonas_sp.AAC.1